MNESTKAPILGSTNKGTLRYGIVNDTLVFNGDSTGAMGGWQRAAVWDVDLAKYQIDPLIAAAGGQVRFIRLQDVPWLSRHLPDADVDVRKVRAQLLDALRALRKPGEAVKLLVRSLSGVLPRSGAAA